eukprot:gene4182-5160_t
MGKKSAHELIESGQELIAQEEYEKGIDTMREAYNLAPDDVTVVDAFGSALAETSNKMEAVAVLQHAVQLSPGAGFEKYMYLGQLLEGEEAIEQSRTGLKLLRKQARLSNIVAPFCSRPI